MRNSNKKYKLKDRQITFPSDIKPMKATTIYRNELRTYSAFGNWAERHPGAFNAILIAEVVAGVIALFLCV